MCCAPCLFQSIGLRILTSRKILKNNWRMKRFLDEPPYRASMKNSGNKEWSNERENWTQLREKYEALEPRFYSSWIYSGRMNQSLGWSKNKNYVMRILHQFRLMTRNGFGILLILVERIKIDIVQTWEGIDGSTGGILETTKELIR